MMISLGTSFPQVSGGNPA